MLLFVLFKSLWNDHFALLSDLLQVGIIVLEFTLLCCPFSDLKLDRNFTDSFFFTNLFALMLFVTQMNTLLRVSFRVKMVRVATHPSTIERAE